MQHAHKTTDLAPDERVAVERLLGRRLESDETVEVITRKLDESKLDERPIWEVMLDNLKDVLHEEIAKLPKDGASEHDHYLYGHPKRSQ